MSETVIVAIIAVAGTAIGAAVSPVVAMLTKAITVRTDDKSTRIKAIAEFSATLRTLATRTPDRWDSYKVRQAHEDAIAQRYEVAKTIPKGAGRVDWFCEFIVDRVNSLDDEQLRIANADYGARQLLSWARGDKSPADLIEFTLEPIDDGDYAVLHDGRPALVRRGFFGRRGS